MTRHWYIWYILIDSNCMQLHAAFSDWLVHWMVIVATSQACQITIPQFRFRWVAPLALVKASVTLPPLCFMQVSPQADSTIFKPPRMGPNDDLEDQNSMESNEISDLNLVLSWLSEKSLYTVLSTWAGHGSTPIIHLTRGWWWTYMKIYENH